MHGNSNNNITNCQKYFLIFLFLRCSNNPIFIWSCACQ